VALRTPATPWIASVTCRTQLLQFMPPTKNSVAPVFFGEADLVVGHASIFATARFYRAPRALSNFALGIRRLKIELAEEVGFVPKITIF